METKSRYEVISDLEKQKRDFIKEKEDLGNDLKAKERNLKDTERSKADQLVAWDRKIDDLEEDIQNFEELPLPGDLEEFGELAPIIAQQTVISQPPADQDGTTAF